MCGGAGLLLPPLLRVLLPLPPRRQQCHRQLHAPASGQVDLAAVPLLSSRPSPAARPPCPADDQRGTTVLTVILAAVFILAYVLSMTFLF